ncbi:hypothetical protein D3C85_1459820 [compost metagenome]
MIIKNLPPDHLQPGRFAVGPVGEPAVGGSESLPFVKQRLCRCPICFRHLAGKRGFAQIFLNLIHEKADCLRVADQRFRIKLKVSVILPLQPGIHIAFHFVQEAVKIFFARLTGTQYTLF